MDKLEIFKDNEKVNELKINNKYKEITKIFLQSKIYGYKIKIEKKYNSNDIIIIMSFEKELFNKIVKYKYKYYFENVEF